MLSHLVIKGKEKSIATWGLPTRAQKYTRGDELKGTNNNNLRI